MKSSIIVFTSMLDLAIGSLMGALLPGPIDAAGQAIASARRASSAAESRAPADTVTLAKYCLAPRNAAWQTPFAARTQLESNLWLISQRK